jgi:hypothetical protein
MITTMNLEKAMNTTQTTKNIIIASAIAFLMLLTRGSHVLTAVSLPDASLALLLFAGLYLRKATWFVSFIVLATVIDFGASAINSLYGFCLTSGYWGMLPTYAVMWLTGVWLSKKNDGLNFVKFSLAGLFSTLLAFVISTQTYYLFSGRFPNDGIIETMQYGWNYLPSYIGFTMMYLVAFWGYAKVLPKFNLVNSASRNIA